jgi:hypothetical protein
VISNLVIKEYLFIETAFLISAREGLEYFAYTPKISCTTNLYREIINSRFYNDTYVICEKGLCSVMINSDDIRKPAYAHL